VAETEVVQVDQKPFGLLVSILRLIWFKVLHIEFRGINDLAVGPLKKIKGELQQWNQDFVLLDVGCVKLLDGERLFPLLAENLTKGYEMVLDGILH
jgi:hypothetical protein